MERIAVIEGVRTPFCKMGSVFNTVKAQDLGRIAAREVIERSNIDPAEFDEVIFGCVGQPADAANVARVIALLAGVPDTVPAYTVHRNCASGIEAAVQACMKIGVGDGECYLVGGTESMSNYPLHFPKSFQDWFFALPRMKTVMQKLSHLAKFRFKYLTPGITLQMGLTDPVCGLIMGKTAEVLAKEYGITREEQDQFALDSHLKAERAKDILREEIVPVIPGPKFKAAIEHDNGVREGQTIEALKKLRPYFERVTGSVTVGNSSQVTDGACALILSTEKKAKELGLKPLGYINAYSFAGVEPHRMGIGPAHAIPMVLKKANMKFDDVQAFEINEAFAAQVIACVRALESSEFAKKYDFEGYTGKIDPSILNVHGGSIALGHPVGTTGARLILTMLKHLNRENLQYGVSSLCIGGGQGAAVLLEKG